ncbi:hypothetical protein RGQ21_02200 [Kitasatospora aureofaciens]|uniref:hypothetical protein n=1 Tax=Streptomyces tendae TaxID=1932 RepID=UPI00136B4735|nr:hypothetical protein [Streptomyces sp. SID5914]MZG17358.1 hypothetical protein [Streptomyces sp. SID5914]BET45238.1 hypothetical protein RGQ21_02200 [Kitasatospora aureofaciens]
MLIYKRRTKAGLAAAAALLSSVGLGVATASPATAAGTCTVIGVLRDDGKQAGAVNQCTGDASYKLYRKFVWNNGVDSTCLPFEKGQKWYHSRPNPYATFEGMKAC